MNDSFVHFASFRKAIRRIKDPMTRLAAYEMLEDYALEGIVPDEDEAPVEVLMLFDAFQPVIDSSISKRTNGSKGGRPKKSQEKTIVSEEGNHGFENKKPTFSESETIVSEEENHRLSKSESNVHVHGHVNGHVHANENVDVHVNAHEKDIPAPDGADVSGSAKQKPVRHKYGEYNNVLLSDDELNKLYQEYGKALIDEKILDLSEYMAKKKTSYKSHYATIRSWIRKDRKEFLQNQVVNQTNNPFLEMLKDEMKEGG